MRGNWHVLIAEDEPSAALALQWGLARNGYRVSTASDGDEALRIASEDPIDVLVTDLRMPKMDGVALIRRLRERQRHLPVVIVSAYLTAAIEHELAKDGIDRLLILPKPLDLACLKTWLVSVLRNGMKSVSEHDQEACRKLRQAAKEVRRMAEAVTGSQGTILTEGAERLESFAAQIEHPLMALDLEMRRRVIAALPRGLSPP